MSTVEQKRGVAATTNGKPDKAAATIPVISPVDGAIAGRVADSTPADVQAAVGRARAAQAEWEAIGFDARAEQLYRLRDALLDNEKEFLDLLVAETGKSGADAYLEVLYLADAIGHYGRKAGKYLADQRVRPSSVLVKNKKLKVVYRPMGVVGMIGPWNFPVILSIGDAVPALMAGNSVVIKPATITPLAVSFLCDLWNRVTDYPDVLQAVTGRGSEIGNALVDHCDYVGFTGSTEIGKKVMARAAKTLTPVSLELGGKDAMIVLADADIERAANGAAAGGLANSGQICMSVERIYVEEPAYDEFVRKLVDNVRVLRQGAGEWSMDVGTMTSEDQLEIVERQVADALKRGARVLAGGRRNEANGKLAYEPTVIVDVDHKMDVMRQETFGPVLPVMKVRDAEEAIELANDSPYGLSGTVWTRDKRRGEQVARRIETGSVCINDALVNYLATEIPFGGWKESGIGVRHGGAVGIRKYCRTESLLFDRTGLKRDPLWYPSSKAKGRLVRSLTHLLYGRGLRRKLGMHGGRGR